MEPAWEQPLFDGGLERVAVDLITGVVQRMFAELDPLALVESAEAIGAQDKRTVADLIDRAVVELDVSFLNEPLGHPTLASER
jgi:hypothetical protein